MNKIISKGNAIKPTSTTVNTIARRNLLKRITTGSSVAGVLTLLPSSWHKPMVDSTLLPAHGGTSFAVISCQSVGPNVGTSEAPGPDIDINPATILSARFNISPAPEPGPDSLVTLEQFRGGTLFSTSTPDVSSGTTLFSIGAGTVGTFEVRFTYFGQTCSVHWTCVDP